MGSPDPRQIDGIGGADPLTSAGRRAFTLGKVAPGWGSGHSFYCVAAVGIGDLMRIACRADAGDARIGDSI
jgi:Uncharacterized protein conserved in bacteria